MKTQLENNIHALRKEIEQLKQEKQDVQTNYINEQIQMKDREIKSLKADNDKLKKDATQIKPWVIKTPNGDKFQSASQLQAYLNDMHNYISYLEKTNDNLMRQKDKLEQELKEERVYQFTYGDELFNFQTKQELINDFIKMNNQWNQMYENREKYINKIDNLEKENKNLKNAKPSITIYNPGKTDEKYHTEKEIQDFINGAYRTHMNYITQNNKNITIYDPNDDQRIFHNQDDIQKFINLIYKDYKENQIVNLQKQMADLQKDYNEAQLKAQHVATIEIHDPLNNSTVDQQETIQGAIDNIYNLYISTKTSSNLFMQMVEDFRK